MQRSAPVDGFELAYERVGAGPGSPPVVLLHGWPGDHRDWRDVAARLAQDGRADIVIPDLRGFGASDRHPAEGEAYSAAGQAASVRGLIAELGLERPVIAGYDIGSRIAQQVAREAPGDVAALVVAPPLPGVGRRVLSEGAVGEFWYQTFHRLPLVESILDGRPDAVRAYLGYIWEHWSGPEYRQAPDELARLTDAYGAPGAFAASVGWYRAGAGTVARSLAERAPAPADRLAVPTTILWPQHDPLFPLEWSDRIDEFFSAATLHRLAGVGHFSPLEAPERFAAAIADVL
jgi:pimeloyl-ACP methyl ester carboxylesterase